MIFVHRRAAMISPQRHRDRRENPSSWQEMARLRLRALGASAVKIRAKQSPIGAGGAGAGRIKCAKRTQLEEESQVSSFKFEVGGPRLDSSASFCFKLHTSDFRRVTGGTSCTNKPNLRRSDMKGKSFMGKELWLIGHATEFGETKPIARPCRVGRGWRDVGRGPCTNKANFSARPIMRKRSHFLDCGFADWGLRIGDRLPGGGRLCKTDPIGPAASGPRRADCAKQTQFPAGRDTPAFHYSIIPIFKLQLYRAKQSQSAGRGGISYHSSIPLFQYSTVPSFHCSILPFGMDTRGGLC